jgi:hypothetical protein
LKQQSGDGGKKVDPAAASNNPSEKRSTWITKNDISLEFVSWTRFYFYF